MVVTFMVILGFAAALAVSVIMIFELVVEAFFQILDGGRVEFYRDDRADK